MPTPVISVILTTYNQPDWLEKSLWGWAIQTDADFEILIADDGSTEETRERVKQVAAEFLLRIRHLWQPDEGFRKSAILNEAIVSSEGNYLLFSDGDCIPRRDLVSVHRDFARTGYFLSGGYTKLHESLCRAITRENVASGELIDPGWLREHGFSSWPWEKHVARGTAAAFFNHFTTTRPTWNGHNSSGWKEDALRVNGFNERMGYGGMDREFGERLVNAGVKPVQIRYHAVMMHLDHRREYSSEESQAENRQIRDEVRRRRIIWEPSGIRKDNDSGSAS